MLEEHKTITINSINFIRAIVTLLPPLSESALGPGVGGGFNNYGPVHTPGGKGGGGVGVTERWGLLQNLLPWGGGLLETFMLIKVGKIINQLIC